MASFEDVVERAQGWPGVTVQNWYGTPGLKADGKGFCRLWGQREYNREDVHDTQVLVVLGDIDEKEVLISSSNGVVFSTPHYEGSRAFLVRLDDSEIDVVVDFVEDSYRSVASRRSIEEFDAGA